MSNVISKFDSLREFIDYADGNPTDNRSSSETDDTQFTGGTHSLREAVGMARNGWDAVRPDVDKMLATIKDSFGERFAKVNRTKVGIAGGAVHMGRYLAGRPDHMVGFHRMPSTRHGKVVRLLVDYGANSGVSAENMRKRGCTLTVLVDALATLGLSVELWTETTVTMGNKSHTTLIKLHDSREPLDINDMMFALAHPSMLRRLTFSVRERAMTMATCRSSSYGSSVPVTQATALESDVVCNRLEHGGTDELMVSDPVAWILQTIEGLGV
jgi:hypothetical protein